MVHGFHPSTWETKAGKSLWLPDQLGLYNKFQVSQDYTERPCLRQTDRPTNWPDDLQTHRQKDYLKTQTTLFSNYISSILGIKQSASETQEKKWKATLGFVENR